jgi:hypothetical protein
MTAAFLLLFWAQTGLAADGCQTGGPPKSLWPHLAIAWPTGIYGRSSPPLALGTCRTCQPQGPLFGYYPTSWQPWPETCPTGWVHGSIPAEEIPLGETLPSPRGK